MTSNSDDRLAVATYEVGLSRIREAVISSHFMHQLNRDVSLNLYDDGQYRSKSLFLDCDLIVNFLVPRLLKASSELAQNRARAAIVRAKDNYQKYGLKSPCQVGLCHHITEVMFDRQYLRGPKENCSRQMTSQKVDEQLTSSATIDMVIAALPFKFSSPLKTRGPLPDLAEVSFMLSLYELVATINLVCAYGKCGACAKFTIVSDGSRFNEVVNIEDRIPANYRCRLTEWIKVLQLQDYIAIVDYRCLIRERLPYGQAITKDEIRRKARLDYANVLWPVLDPYCMAQAMNAAARVDPDPELSNPEGRFNSLVKSLVYTMNYTALMPFHRLPREEFTSLYRDLTGHIFEPYVTLLPSVLSRVGSGVSAISTWPLTDDVKEHIRQSMLGEVWSAAIEYISEIRSDRDLDEDPILTCLPNHIRWTIHAKRGQLALLTPPALGIQVQPWAGTAVFKGTSGTKIRLCTLPVLALEGAGAIPVQIDGCNHALSLGTQPLFYIYPDIRCTDVDDFLSIFEHSFVRNRTR